MAGPLARSVWVGIVIIEFTFASQSSICRQASAVQLSDLPQETKSLTSDERFFAKDGSVLPEITYVSFETDPSGAALARQTDVGNMLGPMGCLFSCETSAGQVVVSAYRFKRGRSKSNSIGNVFVNKKTVREVWFQGTMRIDFCNPDNPEQGASVGQVGMFLEIVLPGHTIVEAYNASGHVIGTVLTTEAAGTSFVGFDSTAPIAYLKIMANRYSDIEALNEDFAVDDLCFSAPAPAPELNHSDSFVVTLHDGTRISAKSIELAGDRIFATEADDSRRSIPKDDLHWIVGPRKEEARPKEGVFVMLSDGSVLHCTADSVFQLVAEPKIQLDDKRITGFWGAKSAARYPIAGDFEHGNQVIVRPTNRIAVPRLTTDLSAGIVAFELNTAVNIQQTIGINRERVSPAVREDVGWKDGEEFFRVSESPSIWFRAPRKRKNGTGLLRTYDGQEFVLGASNFQLEEIGQDRITIAHKEISLSFSLDQIKAFEMPR